MLYKKALDELIGAGGQRHRHDGEQRRATSGRSHRRDRDAEEKLLDRFRDPADPLKFLIVTSKLLTGFDAPILQAMYLDKPLRDHTLLQAICRTNRPYGEEKTHGLIVDYLGIFDDVAQAIQFDEEGSHSRSSRTSTSCGRRCRGSAEVPRVLPRRGSHRRRLRGTDRRAGVPAEQRHARPVRRRLFSAWRPSGRRSRPTRACTPYETDYRWLTQVYESVKPSTGTGKLLWHALGAKTIELIHENVHVEAVRDDLETLVLDAELLEGGPGER